MGKDEMIAFKAHLQAFFDAFVECALWCGVDENDRPLDEGYTEHDIDVESLGEMVRECVEFCDTAGDDLCTLTEKGYSQAGHDFYLTRNHAGAGFWEEDDWPEEMGERLTEISHKFGEKQLYVGGDGKLYWA